MRTSPATRRALGLSSSLALVSAVILSQACGTAAPDPAPATGGSVGTATGGSAATTGGAETGGTATGGAATGGAATGGAETGGTATSTGGASSGGTSTGGTDPGGAASTTGGQPTGGGGSSGASASGGNAGAAGASAGTSGGGGGGNGGAAGSSGGGAGGASASGGNGGAGGGGSGGGGSGGTSAGKAAVAMLMPTSGNQITGTGTFTQTGQSVKLVIQVTNCPVGSHASHIHLNKSCGSNGDDAGAHWVPQGEVLPDIVCAADGTGTAMVTPADGTWTIGTGSGDVTVHALMVHTGDMSNPGGRIACGLINAQ